MKRYLMMSAFALAGLTAATGCPPDPTSVLNQDGGGSLDDLANLGPSILTVNTRTKLDLDVLFVIDNSPSMSPKQKQLATTIDSFIQKIDATGANYHIGVTTTNIGSQTAPNTAFQPGNLNIPGCDSYKGNDGELQRVACLGRDQSRWSVAARDACNLTLCKTKLEPLNGDTYLKKESGITNAPGNDIIGTFKCMAMLGDDGCGLESPLEAMKRALDGHSAVNSGFLRSNSVLAVVFITDKSTARWP